MTEVATRPSMPSQLRGITGISGVTPVVNQIELHPLLTEAATIDLHRSSGIRTQGRAPLARGRLNDNPRLRKHAARHGVGVAQIMLRRHLQLGTVPLPRPSDERRIRGNVDVFGFLARRRRDGRDPGTEPQRENRAAPR
ncbi:aldo/keto reductase [Rhodococcus aetherivorans]|uniref:aldo/keto reductase n=1 Tax=Rhodococcus aetherivorans TaxID=191292 RepID=UPI0002D2426D|nr:aldo/keto reductase [Rhodococcus aetherivorans]CCW14770.1 oxidoreductase [Rhodococcus aetherivorans]